MNRWIIRTSIQLRILIVVLAAVLMAFGAMRLRSMPVDVYPEFNPPIVEVQTEALGLSALEVESLVTLMMEADLLNGVAWLDRISSRSVNGLSSILLIFEPGTDPIRARQMVQERLNQAYVLPNVSQPPAMIQPLSTTGRVMIVGLSSDTLSPVDMGVLARWTIVPRLMGVPGVANVAIWGQRDRQLQVLVDPKRLDSAEVTLQQVIKTTGEALWVSPLSYLRASSPGTSGWIDTPNQRISIQHLMPIVSAEDLAKVTVADSDGLLLGDVATVVEDHQPLIGDAMLNNDLSMLLVIEKFPGADTLAVTRGIDETLEALKPGLSGMRIDNTVYRPASYLEQSVRNLSLVTLIGAFLLTLVLIVLFSGWRTALICLLSIPVSLFAAAYILYLRGATFNTMVLVGLVIALTVIIDDTIINVENVARRLRMFREEQEDAAGMDRKRILAVVRDALIEMRGPVGFATLVTLLSVLPIFFLEGVSGAFFQPLAISYVLAVLAAMLVALTVTPALSTIILADAPLRHRESPLVLRLQRGYHGLLARTVRAPRVAYAAVVVIIIAAVAAVPFLRLSLSPSLKQPYLLIAWESAPGTSHTEMNRVMSQAAQELRSVPGVLSVGSHLGRAVTGDAVVAVNSGELWVKIDPAVNYDATAASVGEIIAGYPGLFRQVTSYQPERLGEALMQTNKDLTVRVYGPDMDALRETAQAVSQAVVGITGVTGARAEVPAEEPQIEIKVDLAKAERYQVKPGDVRRAVTTLVSGLRVGNLYEDQKVFDVVVWGVPEIRNNLTNIRDLLIDTPTGQVRLSEVADVKIVPSPIIIRRDAVSRYMDVRVTVSGRNIADVSAEITRQVRQVPVPLEFHVQVLGNAEAQQAELQRMMIIALVALIGILLLLQAAYKSWRLAFATFLTLPAALAGGVLAAFLSGGVVSLGSLFGYVAILGLAIRFGILQTNHLHQLEHQENEPFGPELVLRGATERLKPELMTLLAVAAVLLPIAVMGDAAGLEILRPLAFVILGGLVTTSVLNLFILPALYLRFGGGFETDLEFDLAPAVTGD